MRAGSLQTGSFRRGLAAAGGWLVVLALAAGPVAAQEPLDAAIDRLASELEPGVIAHRRHVHQHPELGNREFETAKYVARALKKLGLEVRTGIAHTGVVGVLRGARPGPAVALRADMDALPVTEEVDLPFAAKARSTYDGKPVGVMHACGHDAHVAILLGVAQVLSTLRPQLAGTYTFIFQPAEEGAPKGEEGGAELMVKEGVLDMDPKPQAIFGLHVLSMFEADQIAYRAGGTMASSDNLDIVIRGKQTHGAAPWLGVDPIVVASQVVLALQTIASRQMDSTKAPVIVTIGKIDGGVRGNIIPDEVRMKGTLRALDDAMREDLHERVRRTVEQVAAAAGASATVSIGNDHAYPVTYNDPALTARMLPVLRRVAGEAKVMEARPILGAEDFSFFQQKIPGLYLFVGARTPGANPADFPANHSPRFRIDESVLKLGVRTLANLAVSYTTEP